VLGPLHLYHLLRLQSLVKAPLSCHCARRICNLRPSRSRSADWEQPPLGVDGRHSVSAVTLFSDSAEPSRHIAAPRPCRPERRERRLSRFASVRFFSVRFLPRAGSLSEFVIVSANDECTDICNRMNWYSMSCASVGFRLYHVRCRAVPTRDGTVVSHSLSPSHASQRARGPRRTLWRQPTHAV
jgi:hypothetical protein